MLLYFEIDGWVMILNSQRFKSSILPRHNKH